MSKQPLPTILPSSPATAREEDSMGATIPAMVARRPMLATLMIASALSPLAINIFIPSMTSIARDLHADGATVGLGLSLYLVATALIQLIAGPLSDRFGRRPVILGGMVLFLIGTVLCLMAQDVSLFLVGRVVQAASATGIALSRAIVRDVYSRERAAAMIGYVTMGLAVAPMIGPAIGGAMDTALGWRSVFWLLAAMGVLTLALLAFDLSETNREKGKPVFSQFQTYGELVRSGAFWIYVGTSSLTSAVFFAFLGGAPFVAVTILGMTPAGYGLWFVLSAAGYMIGNFGTARLSERLGIKNLMVVGAALTVAATALSLALIGGGFLSPLTLFGPMLLVGVGNGLALPSATAGGVSVRPEAAGAAAGLLGACQIGLGAISSILAAILATGPSGAVGLLLLMTAFGAAGVVCALAARRVRPVS
ncbi:multidrug effflux MFS transporter [Aurantimonas sp. C2-6-R+9]|uniref:multidrug effflux MFS transporter n=1 Tax=unclassified Aurantimonas TaxID=2638230 RepID=UPI002E17F2F4|nr:MULTISPECIES: multidrug effflux MFS transporter [unclassified Aurantimonas]MEC5291676.1 multidrug effflux MFS transporter [Aurantimonas sp. C2-3-R2]MEC5323570.1 multidrug effflux MFS transporter [Aurantimonas sp. A3-2-R12]MEC5381858.1 multidrug effflux MFS transporter [Aurantimonas sp. C2-6-R+9]MEC5412760.1 multidrug effflux MFS transporter [Aurantimonas sp. C2-4-R8]